MVLQIKKIKVLCQDLGLDLIQRSTTTKGIAARDQESGTATDVTVVATIEREVELALEEDLEAERGGDPGLETDVPDHGIDVPGLEIDVLGHETDVPDLETGVPDREIDGGTLARLDVGSLAHRGGGTLARQDVGILVHRGGETLARLFGEIPARPGN